MEANENKEATKKSLGTVIDEHPKTVFWTRFVSWAMFACVLFLLLFGDLNYLVKSQVYKSVVGV